MSSNMSSVFLFGLLKDGCKMEAASCQIMNDGTALLHNLGKDLKSNGYYFQIPKKHMSLPLRWNVQIGQTNGTEWLTVGSSVWRRDADESIAFYPQLSYTPSVGNRMYRTAAFNSDGVEITVNMSPPIQWYATYISAYLWNGIWLLCFLLTAVLRKERYASYFIFLLFATVAVLELLSSIGYWIINAHRESLFIFLWVPADLMVSIGIVLFESQLVKIVLLYSAIGVLVVMIQGYIYELDFLNTCFRMLQSPYAAPALLACIIIMFRWRAVSQAHRLVCNDQALYQLVWSDIISKPEYLTCLAEMKVEVDRLQLGMSSSKPRQRCARQAGSTIRIHSDLSRQRTWLSSWLSKHLLVVPKPLRSGLSSESTGQLPHYTDSDQFPWLDNLDQLYVQATCLQPFLIEKVREWAAACRGLFLASAMDGQILWIHPYVGAGEENAGLIKWCKVKSVERAVQKAVRSYGQVKCTFVCSNRYLFL